MAAPGRVIGPAPAWLAGDKELLDELKRQADTGVSAARERFGIPAVAIQRALATLLAGTAAAGAAETLVLASFARPCAPSGESPASTFWARRLAIAQTDLGKAAAALARIEADGRTGFRWAGVGWLVAESVLITTEDVARMVSTQARAVFSNGARASVVDVETDRESGLAFLRLEGDGLPAPVAVASEPPLEPYVAVIGHPFQDSRAHGELESVAYGAAFGRVSVAPGRVLSHGEPLAHDCAMPGNAAGSVLLDLNSGAAAGLHLGGLLAGSAIGAAAIRQAMDRAAIRVPEAPAEFGAGVRLTPADYADRGGYDEKFLGIRVPLPKTVGEFKDDVQTYTGPNRKIMRELPYTHFSVVMCKSRRLCFYTAVNIDGKQSRAFTRAKSDRWFFDPRIDDRAQCGKPVYSDPAVDLGHMVRRLDPVWGDDFEKANDDTFHFTNACPQHKDLNRKVWNDLEDYLLRNTSSSRMKATVFTGPVLEKSDPAYRGIKLPRQFWKVAVMVTDAGKLHATAYILSQADMITGLSFALFGEFRTYQLPIVDLERMTQIDFGSLRKFDPKGKKEKAVTFSTAPMYTEINGPDDLVL